MTQILERSEKSARKAKGEGHSRRGEILRAAERIFVAEGCEAATIRKIADEVGVSSTALYMHFRDKDHILLEICHEAMDELLRINSTIGDRPLDPVSRVREMLGAYIQFALLNQNAYRLVFCAGSIDSSPSRQDATRALGQRCFERFSAVVAEIAADGRLRVGDPQAAAQALWAACHGLVSLRIAKPDFDWAPADTLADVMLEGLMHGLITD